jgi:hypothetical protein
MPDLHERVGDAADIVFGTESHGDEVAEQTHDGGHQLRVLFLLGGDQLQHINHQLQAWAQRA